MVATLNIKSGKQLLRVFAENKKLPMFIPKLPPSSLRVFIQEVGIADSAELIAYSTLDQFVAVIDESVWSSPRPGSPERFVPEEFLDWIELILELGDEFTSDRLSAMDEDLLVTALSYNLEVANLNLRVVDASEDRQAGQLDAVSGMDSEIVILIDEFELKPVYDDEWPVIEPALFALRSNHPELFPLKVL